MKALNYLMDGRFAEAIDAYTLELAIDPADRSALGGLAAAYMEAGLYEEAIPLKWRVHDDDRRQIPDTCGQLLYLSCAYWCLEDQSRGIALAHELCAGRMNHSINMTPDFADGATFGLVLHYMSLTVGNDAEREFALRFLTKLNSKYDKYPHRYFYPKHTVKQLLGEMTFEEVLEWATCTVRGGASTRDLTEAYQAADGDRTVKHRLGEVLFHDGVIRRARGDEAGCMSRMQEVFDLGYQTESIRWYLARHEVKGH